MNLRRCIRTIRYAFVSIEKTGRHMWCRFFLLSCLVLLTLHASLLSSSAAAATPNPVRVTLGQAVVALNGPWKFHTGDNPLWAEPNFDDSAWETVDLTPPPGAHDSDVGLTDYVPGWQARAHCDYFTCFGGRRWDEYLRRYIRTYSSMSREVLSALRITHVLKHNDVSESGFTTTPSA
jgi:hypothetical protein